MKPTEEEIIHLRERVDAILAVSSDNERAHCQEDALHLELLEKYLPEELKVELARLTDADFDRWYA